VRLTNLGIRTVPGDVIEAGRAFGANEKQILYKIQLPLAMPTILAGINQVILLSLSMVVIASMVGARGLGSIVYQGIQQNDIAKGFESGLGIVVLAIILDRITQSLANKK
jgi:glycine betaine/proline transport system permease protein